MKSLCKSATLCALIVTLSLIVGCSDTTTTPDTSTTDIMPLKAGNYFVYNNYRLDSLTGIKDNNSLRVDSIVIGMSTSHVGKSCYSFDTYIAGVKTATDYFAKESKSIWSFSSLLPAGISTSGVLETILPQGNKWMKIADYASIKDSTWAMYDTTLTNLIIPGIPIPVNAVISMKGKRTADETITIGTTTYTNAHKFEVILSPNATLSGFTIPIGTVKKYMWIADNIGIIKEEFPPIDIQVNVPGVPATRFRSDGFVKELKTYKLQ